MVVYIEVFTRHVEPYLGSVELGRIGVRAQPWLTKLAARVGRPTVDKAKSVLSSVLRFAVLEGAIRANPVPG